MFDTNWGIPEQDKASLSKRIAELDTFLDKVQPKIEEKYGQLRRVEFAANRLGHYYWWHLVTFIRPVLEEGARANRYKVASLLELCIVRLKPLRSTDRGADFRVNAQVGAIAGITVINDFAGEIRIDRPPKSDQSTLAAEIRRTMTDHEDAMFLKDDNRSPILINSGYWQALDWLCALRTQGQR